MTGYDTTIFVFSVLTDLLLLLGAGQLCRIPFHWARALAAAIFGGIHAAVCLLPGFYFLGNTLWRIISLAVMTMIAYGISGSALRGGVLFSLLTLVLGGIGQGGMLQAVSVAGLICLMCYLGFRTEPPERAYVPVELTYGDKHLRITALKDTGNTLRDPITGRQVLVVGAAVAQELTGLTRQQLLKPVESVAALPGLRLIPYHTVGNSSFLLAMRFSDVKIGSWQGSSLVAFAPEGLSMEGNYQALTGGMV